MAPAPSVRGAGPGSGGGASTGARLTSYALDHLLAAALGAVATAPPRLPVAKNKEPLALGTVAVNMRAFTQKSGPIFYFQDAVEVTLVWDDWAWTAMWMLIAGIVALHPHLLLCAPPAILSIILIKTYATRFPAGVPVPPSSASSAASAASTLLVSPTPAQAVAHSTSQPTHTGHGVVRPPVIPNPPHEGEVRYYENLRDIQNMMKMVTDGYDLLAPSVAYLNWSSYPRSLLLLQLSLLSTVLLFIFSPYLPLRLLFLVAVESLFLANHPWIAPLFSGIKAAVQREKEERPQQMPARWMESMEERSREIKAKLEVWMQEDRLDDAVWTRGWREVEMFENERYVPETNAGSAAVPGWSAHNLKLGERKPFTKAADGWSAEELDVSGFAIDISRQVAMSLEAGWEWVDGDEWRIDFLGLWSCVGVDGAGYVYTDSDWQRPSRAPYGQAGCAAPVPQLDGSVRLEGDEDPEVIVEQATNLSPVKKAVTRRRRWLRRAVRKQT